MNIQGLAICCLSFFAATPQILADEPVASEAWKIEIVPSRNSKSKGAILYATKPLDRFYIVLHNISGKDQRVWRDWCSWGYDNLSIQAELADGSKVMLKKTPKEWSKNYPDAALVPAGKTYVFAVHLGGVTWQGLEKLPKESLSLTVIYQIKTSPEATQKNVWVGKVLSKPLTVKVRR